MLISVIMAIPLYVRELSRYRGLAGSRQFKRPTFCQDQFTDYPSVTFPGIVDVHSYLARCRTASQMHHIDALRCERRSIRASILYLTARMPARGEDIPWKERSVRVIEDCYLVHLPYTGHRLCGV